MKLYSTKNTTHHASLAEAVMRGLPPDNGLYMPERIPVLPASFFSRLPAMSLPEIGFHVCRNLMGNTIPEADLQGICQRALTFPAPVHTLDAQRHILELFHGPSLAFKDFGARFMAQLMSYFNRGEDKDLTILVATSGDTGGAVAAGFYQTPGIKVVILYPSGKVSPLQEKQLTTLGHNIQALEVDGTFDDCQALVKQAFLDNELTQKRRLSSANSINIARLIPQSFYYFEAYRQLPDHRPPLAFVVPSGNFGNLTAGLFARKMGLPVRHFVAATNVNDVVPQYLETGEFKPKISVRTLSNAMDVGNPSNFARIEDFFRNGGSSTWNNIQQHILGYSFTDAQTKAALRDMEQKYQYVIDPHGAVGYLAMNQYLQEYPTHQAVLLETAHPAKFLEDVERILGHSIHIPERLARLQKLPKEAIPMTTDYTRFRDWLVATVD